LFIFDQNAFATFILFLRLLERDVPYGEKKRLKHTF